MATTLALTISGRHPALPAQAPVLSDVAKLYPKVYALWGATLPRSLTATPWIRRLDGVVSPVRSVTIGGQAWRFGTVCVPHDCGSNILGLLFSARQDEVKAVAKLSGTNDAPTLMIIGEMDATMMGCIRKFTDDYEAQTCP